MNDEDIVNIYYSNYEKSKRINGYKLTHKFINSHNEIKQYLLNRYNDIPENIFSYKEVVFRIKNNITVRPVCKSCGKPVIFEGYKNLPYRHFCSTKCSSNNKDVIAKQQSTLLNTLHNKYGDNISNVMQLQFVKDKEKNTFIQKYGVDHNFKRPGVYDNSIKSAILNGTLGGYKSKPEQFIKKLLSDYFEVKSHYSSILYPFHTDIYLPEMQLYIEYHGSMFHNYKPYNYLLDVKEKQSLINKITSEKSKYNSVIDTWCYRDIKKIITTINNNINYLILYPSWIDNWKKYYMLGDKINLDVNLYIKNKIITTLFNIIKQFSNENHKQLYVYKSTIFNLNNIKYEQLY